MKENHLCNLNNIHANSMEFLINTLYIEFLIYNHIN
jgi:hypothetical protein